MTNDSQQPSAPARRHFPATGPGAAWQRIFLAGIGASFVVLGLLVGEGLTGAAVAVGGALIAGGILCVRSACASGRAMSGGDLGTEAGGAKRGGD